MERDSVPIHLLGTEPLPNTAALAHLLGSQPDLWKLYGDWIVSTHPALWEEIRHMARAKKFPFTIDWQGMRKVMGEEEFSRQVAPLLKESRQRGCSLN